MLFDRTGNITSDDTEDISLESMSSIMEMILLEGLSDDELSEFLGSRDEVNTALHENIVMEKTIVKLDKKAKLTKAQKMAVFTIAKEKNDPKFKKLLTVWKMERYLEAYLNKKYGNEAMRRAKKAMSTASNSKAKMVQTAASKVKRQFNNSAKLK